MANYAAERVCRAGGAAYLSSDVRLALRQLSARGLLAAELRARELGRILDALARAHIVPALFKGAVLAHTVYPLACCRPMGDLDLWLTAEEMAQGQLALQELGYRQRVKERRPVALQAQRSGEIQMVGQPQEHLAAGLCAAGFQKANVPRGHIGVERKVELAHPALPTPVAQERPNRACCNHHGRIVRQLPPRAHDLAGNRHASPAPSG